MKQLTILIVMLLYAVTANAQLKFQTIETTDSTSTFVFKYLKMEKEAKATSASLINDEKNINPLSIVSEYENCINTYRMTFPRQPVFNKTTVIIVIDGKKYTENIWEDITKAAIQGKLSGNKAYH